MRLLLLAAVVMLSTPPPHVLGAHFPGTHQEAAAYCPVLEDRCRCTADLQEFVCKTAGFTAVPTALPNSITKLDLTSNNITRLDENSLKPYDYLEELILSDNKLLEIHQEAFTANVHMKRLILQNCGLTEIPTDVLSPMKKLHTLQLGQNEIWSLEEGVFRQLPLLRSLRLDGNRLRAIPTGALEPLELLEVLNLGNNFLTSIPMGVFPKMENLVVLLMKRNQIMEIDDDAFANMTSLRVIELDDNYLAHIPAALTKLPSLQDLSISGNRIKFIPGGLLQKTPGLALLELKGNPLVRVDTHAFSFLPRLRKLQDIIGCQGVVDFSEFERNERVGNFAAGSGRDYAGAFQLMLHMSQIEKFRFKTQQIERSAGLGKLQRYEGIGLSRE